MRGIITSAFTIRVSTICRNHPIRLFETAEEDKTHVVRELAYDGKWHMGEMQIKNAIEGTGIASVTYIANAQRQIRVYYQSPDLLLREYCHNNKGWFAGKFAGHVCMPLIQVTDWIFFFPHR